MKVIRTRIAVAIASSAVMAGGFGLTGIALGSTGSAATSAVASSHIGYSICSNTTVIDYCQQR